MVRRERSTDYNQKAIVKTLRKIPGVTVEIGHDDVLVGYQGKTFWFEVKTPECRSKKDGEILPSAKRPDQVRLDADWTGWRMYATCVEDILEAIGLQQKKGES